MEVVSGYYMESPQDSDDPASPVLRVVNPNVHLSLIPVKILGKHDRHCLRVLVSLEDFSREINVVLGNEGLVALRDLINETLIDT